MPAYVQGKKTRWFISAMIVRQEMSHLTQRAQRVGFEKSQKGAYEGIIDGRSVERGRHDLRLICLLAFVRFLV